MTTETKPDEVTGRVVDAAFRQFVDFGLKRSTMDDVAQGAGVSRITVYRRFSSKEELVTAVLVRELGHYFERVDEALAGAGDVRERWSRAFLIGVSHVRDHPLFDRLLRTEPEAILPALTTESNVIVPRLRALIADRLAAEVERGELNEPADVEVLSEVLARLGISLLVTRPSVLDDPDDGEIRRFAEVAFARWFGT